jgi:hypothetical protein
MSDKLLHVFPGRFSRRNRFPTSGLTMMWPYPSAIPSFLTWWWPCPRVKNLLSSIIGAVLDFDFFWQIICAFVPGISPWLMVGDFAHRQNL